MQAKHDLAPAIGAKISALQDTFVNSSGWWK